MERAFLCPRIAKDIANLKRPTIVGINGAITSGKTMLSLKLNQYLQKQGTQTQLIHMDDFHTPRAIRFGDFSVNHYFEHAMDLNLFCELISEIKRHPVHKTMTLLDMNTDTYVNHQTYVTDKDTVVIVEGVLLYRPPMEDLFDYRVYLHVDEAEILRRGKARDVPLYGEGILAQYERYFIPIQKEYVRRYSPKSKSHLAINNNCVDNPVIL